MLLKYPEIKDIALDLDGVFADFYSAIISLMGPDWTSLSKNEFWKVLGQQECFFKKIQPLPYARELFDVFKDTDHFILTALPLPTGNFVNARDHKVEWVRTHLSDTVRVETVVGGKNKGPMFAKPDRLLIDDTLRNIEIWEAHGGIGIHHTSFENTIEQLKEFGI